MSAFILDLGEQDFFGPQGRGAGDPIAFRLHPDHLRMSVLADLPNVVRPIIIGHPILWLYFFFCINVLLKFVQFFLKVHSRDFGFTILDLRLF